MASLDYFIKISISDVAKTLSQLSFNVPMVVGYHTAWPELVRTYTDPLIAASDGLPTHMLDIIDAIFSQSPNPGLVKVGRTTHQITQGFKITPIAVNSTVYTIGIASGSGAIALAHYTSDSSATVAEIVTGLKSAIDALVITGVTTVDNSTYLQINGAAGTYVKLNTCYDTQSPAADGNYVDVLMEVLETSADSSFATDLDSILSYDPAWYGLAIDQHSPAIIAAVAAWVETNKKFYFAGTEDTITTGSGSGDIASTLKTSAYRRTLPMFQHEVYKAGDAAWMGALFPFTPGSQNPAYKTLAGIPATNGLQGGQLAHLEGKFCSYYVPFAGVNVTRKGNVPSGEWADVVMGIDWMGARMQQRIYTLLLQNPKIPYTDAGIQMIAKEVLAQILEGASDEIQFVNPDPSTYSVTAPTAASVTTKNTRALNLRFAFEAAGAINDVNVTGIVTS